MKKGQYIKKDTLVSFITNLCEFSFKLPRDKLSQNQEISTAILHKLLKVHISIVQAQRSLQYNCYKYRKRLFKTERANVEELTGQRSILRNLMAISASLFSTSWCETRVGNERRERRKWLKETRKNHVWTRKYVHGIPRTLPRKIDNQEFVNSRWRHVSCKNALLVKSRLIPLVHFRETVSCISQIKS